MTQLVTIAEAIRLFLMGLLVIPTLNKVTMVKWDPWLENLSLDTIREHWTQYPHHELGFITGDNIIVLDADSDEAVKQLYHLEKHCDCVPNLTVTTVHGEHHYFLGSSDVPIRAKSFSTEREPGKIDIKTGRSMVVLPPSPGKEWLITEVDHVSELTLINQALKQALYKLNEMKDRISVPSLKPSETSKGDPKLLPDLSELLYATSPNTVRDIWISKGMAIHHETGGSEAGLKLFDEWSSEGSSYPGHDEIEYQYNSFKQTSESKYTIGTLMYYAEEAGVDVSHIKSKYSTHFQRLDTPTVVVKPKDTNQPVNPKSPFEKFNLTDQVEEYEKELKEQVLVLGELALQGQITIFYAPPNSGKTLITLHEIINAIDAKLVAAINIIVVNADDNFNGLVTKMGIAKEHGFQMLAPGHKEFKVEDFTQTIEKATRDGSIKNLIIIVDTAKKFVDLMSKTKASAFMQILRQAASKGGTIILLAHVNKKRSEDGKPVYAGTSDFRDDADCTHILDILHDKDGYRTVEFVNDKSRGWVAPKAAYRYMVGQKVSYDELLASVERVSDDTADELREEASHLPTDEEQAVIDDVQMSIKLGINTKEKLVDAARQSTRLGRATVRRTIDKYAGTNPNIHKWSCEAGAHGSKVYQLLPPPTGEAAT